MTKGKLEPKLDAQPLKTFNSNKLTHKAGFEQATALDNIDSE